MAPKALGIAPAFSATSSASATPASEGWRVYEMTTEVTLPAASAPAKVWVPLTARHLGDYQRTLSNDWIAPGAQTAAATSGAEPGEV